MGCEKVVRLLYVFLLMCPSYVHPALHKKRTRRGYRRIEAAKKAFGNKQGVKRDLSDTAQGPKPIFEGYGKKCEKKVLLPTGINGDCTFDLDEHSSYLPDLELVKKLQVSRVEPWATDAEKYLSDIKELQNPTDCKRPNSRHATPTTKYWHLALLPEHGFAYNLYMFAHLCGTHWLSGVPMITGNSVYRFTDTKCGKGWSCLFSPVLNNACVMNLP
jgi:hypothetical protein